MMLDVVPIDVLLLGLTILRGAMCPKCGFVKMGEVHSGRHSFVTLNEEQRGRRIKRLIDRTSPFKRHQDKIFY